MVDTQPETLDQRKLHLEELRFRSELIKWTIVAVGAVASFYLVDLGKLRLEEFKARRDNQRTMLEAYLKATEAAQPEVWKRKLRVLETFSDDSNIQQWAKGELKYIDDFAAKEALYRETLRVASQLVATGGVADAKSAAERHLARGRFEQLYWADLPFVGEDQAVIAGMIGFRRALMAAEARPDGREEWDAVNVALIELSKALRDSLPKPVR